MTAPVLLWCATAVALLTTLAGATEIAAADDDDDVLYTLIPKYDQEWTSQDVKRYKRLSKSIQTRKSQVAKLQAPWLKEGANANEDYDEETKRLSKSIQTRHLQALGLQGGGGGGGDGAKDAKDGGDVAKHVEHGGGDVAKHVEHGGEVWKDHIEKMYQIQLYSQLAIKNIIEDMAAQYNEYNESMVQVVHPDVEHPEAVRRDLASLNRASSESEDDLQAMNQDKKNALKPSLIFAMPGLILLVFPLTILFLYMIHSKSKERNVNHKD